MRIVKKIVVGALVVFVLIQFIRPARNKRSQLLPTDISKLVPIPDSVRSLLQTACYDCHSNNTSYPWYMNVQPMGWLMAKHIREGREELNFSEFGGYSHRRQVSKLKAISSSVKDGTMPLSSYTLLHQDAMLSEPAKRQIIKWATAMADSIQTQN